MSYARQTGYGLRIAGLSNKTLNNTNKTLKLRNRESQRERGDERETVQR
jgi:hypothetical protein